MENKNVEMKAESASLCCFNGKISNTVCMNVMYLRDSQQKIENTVNTVDKYNAQEHLSIV